jgi:hypothetical protein
MLSWLRIVLIEIEVTKVIAGAKLKASRAKVGMTLCSVSAAK